MEKITSTALERLDDILPLLSGLRSLGKKDAALYCKLLNSYVQGGRALTRNEADEQVGDAVPALERLVNRKLIVVDADGNPAGAYPFTSQQREHKVHINNVTVHCMCALDALAVSPMFNMPAVIDSECRITGKEIHIEQNGISLEKGTLNAWLGINWGAATHDIVCAESLCLEMMFMANETVAKEWLQGSPKTREIFDLPSAADLAAAFFVPLAEHCRE